MPDKSHSPNDLRAFWRREERRLILIIMVFVVVVGGIAIGIVYGWTMAAMGGICLVIGAAVLGSLWLILTLIERWIGHE